MEKEKLSKKLKRIAVKHLKLSTAHAIPNITRSPKLVVKLVWAFFLLASLGGCGFLMGLKIIEYFSFDVSTKIRELNEFPSVFPTISICNLNPFTSQYAIEFLRNVGAQNNLSDIFDDELYYNLSYFEQRELSANYFSIGN